MILGGSACALVLAISAAKGVCNTLETLLEFRSPTGDVKGPSLNIENEGVKTRKKHGKGEPTQFAKTSVSLRGALVHTPASVAMIIVVLTRYIYFHFLSSENRWLVNIILIGSHFFVVVYKNSKGTTGHIVYVLSFRSVVSPV